MNRVTLPLALVVADEKADRVPFATIEAAEVVVRAENREHFLCQRLAVRSLPLRNLLRKSIERLSWRYHLGPRGFGDDSRPEKQTGAEGDDARNHCCPPVSAGSDMGSRGCIGSGISHRKTRMTPNNIANAAMNTIHPEKE